MSYELWCVVVSGARGRLAPRGGGCAAGAVELRTGLVAEFRLDLPATVTFDYPSSSALAAFIAAQLTDATGVDGRVGAAEASRCTLAIADKLFRTVNACRYAAFRAGWNY